MDLDYSQFEMEARTKEELDELTGLPGRRQFLLYASSKLEANKGLLMPVRFSFLYFNIINFKYLNVNYGVAEGDQVLCTFAQILREQFRESLISRFSDDHFVVLAKEETAIDGIRKVSEIFHEKNLGKDISVKAGIYHLTDSKVTLPVAADLAKYACDYIKNDDYFYMVYHQGLEQKGELAKYLSHNLEKAIEIGAIKVYYQPVIRTMTGDLCGKEALSRWVDPIKGFLSPAEFIPVLEREKLIHKLDIFIVHQVCRDLKRQIENGENAVPVSINFSRLDFILCDPYEEVESAAKIYNIPRNLLCVEITESSLMDDPEKIKETILKFHKSGYSVWMDDFGSGFSSLNVLKDFDFDEVKIDMIFLRNFSEKSKRIIRHVIMMAKELGLETLAEGVETEEQYRFLKENGCEKVQGYYFGKPSTLTVFNDNIAEKGIHTESFEEREYFDKIGKWNLIQEKPFSLLQFDGNNFQYFFINQEYLEQLKSLGTESVEVATFNLNNQSSMMYIAYRKYAEQAMNSDEKIVITYIDRGQTMRLEISKIAKLENKVMFGLSLENLMIEDRSKKQKAIDTYIQSLTYLYDSAYVLHLDEDYSEELMDYGSFSNLGKSTFNIKEIRDWYVYRYVYYKDRERYLAYSDSKTLAERLKRSEKGLVCEAFRTLNDKTGKFEWKTHLAVIPPNTDGSIVVEFIRDTARDIAKEIDSNESLRHDELFDLMMRTSKLPYCWKDQERKYVGANKAFLEFAGVKSFAELAGKTDEEIGWFLDGGCNHIGLELRCLEHGEKKEREKVQWIISGAPKDFYYSVYPVFREGRIVGLMNIVESVEGVNQLSGYKDTRLLDPITGVLNNYAARSLGEKLDESRRLQDLDYVLTCIEIDNYDYLLRTHGERLGNELLKKTVEILNNHKFGTSVIARMTGGEFLIFDNSTKKERVETYVQEAVQEIRSISEVNGVGCEISVCYTMKESEPSENWESILKQLRKARSMEQYGIPQTDPAERKEDRQEALSIYDFIPIPLAVFRVIYNKERTSVIDTEFVYVNQRYCEMANIKREALIGKRYTEAMPNAKQFWFDYCYDAVVLEKECQDRVYVPETGNWMRFAIAPSGIPDCCSFAFLVVDQEVEEEVQREKYYSTENAVVQIIQFLNMKSDYETLMNELLEKVSHIIHPERLLLVETGGKNLNHIYEWRAEGVPETIQEMGIIPTQKGDSSWLEMLKEEQSICLKTRNQLKGKKEAVYRMLERIQSERIIAVPLLYDGQMLGYFGASDYEEDCRVEVQDFMEKIASFIAAKVANHRAMTELEYLSNYDSLTGVGNRHAAFLQEERLEATECSAGVIFADLNELKYTNDMKGHEEGDKLLMMAANILSELYGSRNVYRTGGDEFLVILEEISKESFEIEKNRLRERLSKEEGFSLAKGFEWCENTRAIREAIQQADKEMYDDKKKYHLIHSRHHDVSKI